MTTVDVFIYDWDVKCKQTGSKYIQFEISDTIDLSSDRPFLIPASISLPISLLHNWICYDYTWKDSTFDNWDV